MSFICFWADAEAVRWFRKAADQGYVGAQHMLGLSYANVSSPSTQFGVGVGLGLNIRIRQRIGVALDLHAVHAVSTEIWVIRSAAGFYYRF